MAATPLSRKEDLNDTGTAEKGSQGIRNSG